MPDKFEVSDLAHTAVGDLVAVKTDSLSGNDLVARFDVVLT